MHTARKMGIDKNQNSPGTLLCAESGSTDLILSYLTVIISERPPCIFTGRAGFGGKGVNQNLQAHQRVCLEEYSPVQIQFKRR